MSKPRHRPFREVAKQLQRDQAAREAKHVGEPRRFEDLVVNEGIRPLAGEARMADREPPAVPPSRPTAVPAFTWHDQGGRLEGWRTSRGSRSLRGLAAASPCSTLDLHGATLPEARRAVLAFLRERRDAADDIVKVVVGKGRHSEGGIGVLRDAIGGWLTSAPAAHHVLAFVSAAPRNGGSGAVMIRLQSPGLGRKQR